MTEESMYNHIRYDIRNGTDLIQALFNVFNKCNVDMLPFNKGDKHLYIRCDNLNINDIKTIIFLSECNYSNIRFVAFTRKFIIGGIEEYLQVPYINIYKL